MKIIKYFLTVLMISGCGKADDDRVDVTLITPIGMNRSFHQLSEQLLGFPGTSELFTATDCYQQNIFVGNNEQEGSNALITKRLKIRSSRLATHVAQTPHVWITTYSTLMEPITLSVLKNTPVDIGIMGAFYTAATGTSVDECETISGSFAIPNAGMAGHKIITVSSTATVPMNIWDIQFDTAAALTNPVPSTTPSATQFSCLDSPTNQQCAGKEYVKISSTSNTGATLIKAEYFQGASGQRVIHEIKKSGGGAVSYYIPHFFPMWITYYDAFLTSNVTLTVSNPSQTFSVNNTVDTISFTSF